MSDLPNLLWHSNSPLAPTGYGNQTALFLPKLRDRYQLACSAFYGLEGNILKFEEIPVFPGLAGTYGNEVIHEHARVFFGGDLRGGLVVTLMDVWVLDPLVWRQVNAACWTPIDHEPAPLPIVEFFHNSGAVPIAMSRFGERMLRDADLDPLYVPHAVDRSVYRPQDKAGAREKLKMPKDAFIVGMVAANKGNPSRKCFIESLQAFKALRDKHSEACLYLHTEATGRFDGINLAGAMRQLGVDPKSVIFCDQWRAVHYPFPPEHMAQVYSAMDVLLMPSRGEGFGIPALEAQACGVPVIGSDFSAQPEVIGAGWLVGGQRTYTPLKAWVLNPDLEEIIDSLERCYAHSGSAYEKLSLQASRHAESYDVGKVLADHMLPALTEAQERFAERKPMSLEPVAA